MTRIARDPNQWRGDLNGDPKGQSLEKANGGVTLQLGHRDVVAGGVAKTFANVHRVTFELTGDGIVYERDPAGVLTPVADALNVHVPRQSEIVQVDTVVHQSFLGDGAVDILASAVVGVAPVLPAVTLQAVVLTAEGYVSGAPISVKTNEFGGELFFNFTGVLPNPGEKAGGKAEVIVYYRTI